MPGGLEQIEATGLSAAIEIRTNEHEGKPLWLHGDPSKVRHAFVFSGDDWNEESKDARFKIARAAGPQTSTVTIRRGDGGPIAPRVLSVERRLTVNKSEPFRATATVREITPGEHYELEIHLAPPWPNSGYIGVVRLATGVPEQANADVDFWPRIPQRLKAEAGGWPVPRVRSTTHELTYHFIWSDERPPGRITAVHVNVPGIRARIDRDSGEDVVMLEIPPETPAPKKQWDYEVRFDTDDPAVPELRMGIPFEEPPTIQPRST